MICDLENFERTLMGWKDWSPALETRRVMQVILIGESLDWEIWRERMELLLLLPGCLSSLDSTSGDFSGCLFGWGSAVGRGSWETRRGERKWLHWLGSESGAKVIGRNILARNTFCLDRGTHLPLLFEVELLLVDLSSNLRHASLPASRC